MFTERSRGSFKDQRDRTNKVMAFSFGHSLLSSSAVGVSSSMYQVEKSNSDCSEMLKMQKSSLENLENNQSQFNQALMKLFSAKEVNETHSNILEGKQISPGAGG